MQVNAGVQLSVLMPPAILAAFTTTHMHMPYLQMQVQQCCALFAITYSHTPCSTGADSADSI